MFPFGTTAGLYTPNSTFISWHFCWQSSRPWVPGSHLAFFSFTTSQIMGRLSTLDVYIVSVLEHFLPGALRWEHTERCAPVTGQITRFDNVHCCNLKSKSPIIRWKKRIPLTTLILNLYIQKTKTSLCQLKNYTLIDIEWFLYTNFMHYYHDYEARGAIATLLQCLLWSQEVTVSNQSRVAGKAFYC